MQTFLNGFEVELIKHGNDDLTVVNAARVSNNKQVGKFASKGSSEATQRKVNTGMGDDESLINFLARNNHWTPFAHCRFEFTIPMPSEITKFITWAGNMEYNAGFKWYCNQSLEGKATLHIDGSLYGWLKNTPPLDPFVTEGIFYELERRCPYSYKAFKRSETNKDCINFRNFDVSVRNSASYTFRLRIPIFVARQLMRSNIGIVYNEMSRRYVSDKPRIWYPLAWRMKPKDNVKQGSDDLKFIAYDKRYFNKAEFYNGKQDEELYLAEGTANLEYLNRINYDVAPELARTCLPQSTFTELWMTGTQEAMNRVISLRSEKTESNQPQHEIMKVAQAMHDEIEKENQYFGVWR